MYAAIDLGSNSFHLLIADVSAHGVEEFDRYSEKVQLAEHLQASGVLGKPAMRRGYECLEELRQHLSWFDVNETYAVGTFALRSARNAKTFLKEAEKILGQPVEVLSGDEEARVIYQGLQLSQQPDSDALVIDIGGGSTEFAIGSGDDLRLTVSEAMGCVTLRDAFFHDDRIRARDYKAAAEDVRQWVQLPACDVDGHYWEQAWGTSGTMKAIARILHGLHGEGYIIKREQLAALLAHVLGHQRLSQLEYPELKEDRKPLLLPGIAIISEIMDELQLSQIHVSTASLREGLVWRMAGYTI